MIMDMIETGIICVTHWSFLMMSWSSVITLALKGTCNKSRVHTELLMVRNLIFLGQTTTPCGQTLKYGLFLSITGPICNGVN